MTIPELNVNQRAIVEGDESPTLVVAGPGAGKTTVLQCRIERLLSLSPGSYSRVLGITFTTAAAGNLRNRLDALSPEKRDRVEIGTFHAFAARVLQQHGSHLGLSPNFAIISSLEDRAAIMTSVLNDLGVTSDARPLLPLLNRLYERGASVDDLAGYVRMDAPHYLPQLYRGYVETSIKHGQLDFALLIYLCNQLFQRVPAVSRQLRKVYRQIYVDEFQDTNDSQFRLLELLAGSDSSGLLFLADQDQIIYQWNGASPRRLKEAQERFSMRVLLLPTSFRCPNQILELANRLIANNSTRFVTPQFETVAQHLGSVEVRSFDSDSGEAQFIAKTLCKLDPGEYEDAIVLARSRRILEPAVAEAKKLGLPAVLPTARYDFESAPLVMLYNVLRLAAVPGNESALERLTGAFYEMTGIHLDPTALRAEAQASSTTPLEAFTLAAAQLSPGEQFEVFARVIVDELVARSSYRNVSSKFFEWVESLGEDKGKTAYTASYPDEKSIWQEFERSHRGLESEAMPLSHFLRLLDLESKTPTYLGQIKFITVHGAKGLEYEHVYLMGAAEGQFPAFQAVQAGPSSEQLEEERRSFFVAITRAKHSLKITYAQRYRGYAAKRSRFLAEMGLVS